MWDIFKNTQVALKISNVDFDLPWGTAVFSVDKNFKRDRGSSISSPTVDSTWFEMDCKYMLYTFSVRQLYFSISYLKQADCWITITIKFWLSAFLE